MAKYGWKKGQGLGATNDGIVNALSVTQGAPAKKGQEKGPIGMQAGSRGHVVSETKEAREKAEKARYGEPTKSACSWTFALTSSIASTYSRLLDQRGITCRSG
jgi:splicing factor 45